MKVVISNCKFSDKSFIKEKLNEYNNYSTMQLLQIKPVIIKNDGCSKKSKSISKK